VRKWSGALTTGWFLLLPPSGGDPKTIGNKSESLLGWTNLAALACEHARQAKAEGDRWRAV
jgi:hypothetical protein